MQHNSQPNKLRKSSVYTTIQEPGIRKIFILYGNTSSSLDYPFDPKLLNGSVYKVYMHANKYLSARTVERTSLSCRKVL